MSKKETGKIVKRMKKPDLESQAYISVSQGECFDILSLEMTRKFSMMIRPVIGKGNTFKAQSKDGFQVQFTYDSKGGLPIEIICKNLERMARMIRKHYK